MCECECVCTCDCAYAVLILYSTFRDCYCCTHPYLQFWVKKARASLRWQIFSWCGWASFALTIICYSWSFYIIACRLRLKRNRRIWFPSIVCTNHVHTHTHTLTQKCVRVLYIKYFHILTQECLFKDSFIHKKRKAKQSKAKQYRNKWRRRKQISVYSSWGKCIQWQTSWIEYEKIEAIAGSSKALARKTKATLSSLKFIKVWKKIKKKNCLKLRLNGYLYTT